MHYHSIIVLSLLHLSLSHLPLDDSVPAIDPYNIDSKNFVQLAERDGYTATEFNVTTDDGYVITLFRMRSNQCTKTKRYPTFLLHGLFQCSDSWTDGGKDGSLAYCLADDCYDLWVGNVRGNYYGRRHIKLNPDTDSKFWEFSLDEIGMYDVPAQMDFILKTTGQDKLNYVGYSQGGGTYIIACDQKPEYKEKTNLFVGVTPATRLKHTTNILSRIAVTVLEELKGVLPKRGDDQEILYRGSNVQTVAENICDLRIGLGLKDEVCTTFADLIDSPHPGSLSSNTTDLIFHHFPAGVSVKLLIHYSQLMRSKSFRKYSYGKDNIAIYGRKHSPKYNLKAINVPTMCIHGPNDGLVNVKDFDWMVRELPNVMNVTRVADPLWNHLDMGYNKDVRFVTYPPIKEYMDRYNSD